MDRMLPPECVHRFWKHNIKYLHLNIETQSEGDQQAVNVQFHRDLLHLIIAEKHEQRFTTKTYSDFWE